jgi:hypothetical protein
VYIFAVVFCNSDYPGDFVERNRRDGISWYHLLRNCKIKFKYIHLCLDASSTEIERLVKYYYQMCRFDLKDAPKLFMVIASGHGIMHKDTGDTYMKLTSGEYVNFDEICTKLAYRPNTQVLAIFDGCRNFSEFKTGDREEKK